MENGYIDNYIQILHCRGCHWITACTIGCPEGVVNIYDSLYTHIDVDTKTSIRKVFSESSSITFALPNVQRQKGTHDCGLFALTFATKLCFSQDSIILSFVEFTQDALCGHLIGCLEAHILWIFLN